MNFDMNEVRRRAGITESDNPEAIDKRVPTGQIEWLVGRLHVSATDEEVIAEFSHRMDSFPEEVKKAVYKYALETHAKNQGVYTSVMSGRF